MDEMEEPDGAGETKVRAKVIGPKGRV